MMSRWIDKTYLSHTSLNFMLELLRHSTRTSNSCKKPGGSAELIAVLVVLCMLRCAMYVCYHISDCPTSEDY